MMLDPVMKSVLYESKMKKMHYGKKLSLISE